jgi:hypothetical protein
MRAIHVELTQANDKDRARDRSFIIDNRSFSSDQCTKEDLFNVFICLCDDDHDDYK